MMAGFSRFELGGWKVSAAVTPSVRCLLWAFRPLSIPVFDTIRVATPLN